jgi:hypothetical protein
MLLLTSPNDRLQIVTSAAATINVHASWVDTDTSSGAVTPGRTNTAIATAATTSIAGAPVAGVQRNVKTLHLRNTHATLACDVTVQHTDGTVVAQLYKLTMQPQDMLEYTDQGGFARGGVLLGSQTLGGALSVVNPTLLRFTPYAGGYIKHNGVLRPIPSAGIAGLANTNVLVGNVPGSSLVANATYLVFVTDVNGVLTADFHAGVEHHPSTAPGNEGTEIMTGAGGASEQQSFSLIGMVRTNASAQFVNTPAQRFVRSWFQKNPLAMTGPAVNGVGTSYAVQVSSLGSQIDFISWANETVYARFAGFVGATAPPPGDAYCGVLIDTSAGATLGAMTYHTSTVANAWGAVCPGFSVNNLAEGYHFISYGAFTNGANTIHYGELSGFLGGPRPPSSG